MKISFRTKKLQKQYENVREAEKAYSRQVARKFIMRINILKSAKNFDELYSLPGLDFHALKGNRKGEYAMKLTGFWRLIITNDGERFDIAKIEEVSDHYGD
ncbi:MAG: type II toxin-antitoxin system RelE/ParE family toxin [Campylobacterota bacterium]